MSKLNHNMKKIQYFNSKINKLNELEIRNSDAGQVLFVPYSKADRCNKCALYYYEASCQKTPCTKKERRDKLTGYYRQYRAQVGHEFPVPTTIKIIN
jgi:hypothetical protein